MIKKNDIRWILLSALLAFFQLHVAAQCNHDGYIVENTGCNNGTVVWDMIDDIEYEVTEVLPYEVGTCIHFSFTAATDNPYCPEYPKIELTCFEVTLDNCAAVFEHDQTGNSFNFYNLSEGDLVTSEWVFDGNILENNDPVVTWDFTTVGFHEVCLTITTTDGCFSTTCNDEIFAGPIEEICDYTDCVYPGDTNGDGFANVYDLLNLGLGYNTFGPSRQVNGLDWDAAYSPNWDITTITGLDYKHLDCNGDGWINEQDLQGIETNYVANDNVFEVTEVGAPQVWLELTQDSIFIDENSPSLFTVEAKLMVGTEGNPIDDLKGLALVINYPGDFIEEGSPTFDYHDDSFFGSTNEIIWIPEDRPLDGKLDLGFVQKWDGVDGNGEVGTLQIIIVGDIIDGRSETYLPLSFDIEGVTATNSNGSIKALGEYEGAELIIVNNLSTNTNEQFVSEQVAVFPNPATENITIDLGDLSGETFALYNTVGKEVLKQTVQGNQMTVALDELNQGVYLLKIWTNQGVAIKKIMVE